MMTKNLRQEKRISGVRGRATVPRLKEQGVCLRISGIAREESSQTEKMWSSEMKLKRGSDHRVYTESVVMESLWMFCQGVIRSILHFTDNSDTSVSHGHYNNRHNLVA